MQRILIFGNSGSGKSTLARELMQSHQLAHLDLDELAWADTQPPQRAALKDSLAAIRRFTDANANWVIEGCYTDLLELIAPKASELIYLNLPIEDCIENARNRPWEPHKYASKAAQDENLDMLISWIAEYESRDDVFSQRAHQALYDNFEGKKTCFRTNVRHL